MTDVPTVKISTAKPWIALKMSRATWYRLGKPETKPEKKLTQKTLMLLVITDQGGGASVRSMQRGKRLQDAALVMPEVSELVERVKAGKLKLGTAERLVFGHLRGSRSAARY
jgi:hypothetical protein